MGIEEAVAFEVSSFLIASGVSAEATAVLTPLILTATAVAAVTGVQLLLAPHLPGQSGPQAIDPGRAKEQVQTADSPELRLIGRGRSAGVLAFGDTAGFNRYRLSLQVKGEIDAVEDYFLGNRAVTVEDDGSVSSPPWSIPGGSYAYVFTKPGDGTETAWPQLLAEFSGLWTPAHRVRGIAQTLAKFVSPGVETPKFFQLFQGGIPPVSENLRGERAYDARTAIMAWSENGIVNAWHILRSYPELADLSLYDLPFMAAEAARADVPVRRHNGSATARARAWGFWSSEDARGDTMQQVLDSIGALIVPRAGSVVNGIQEVKLGIQLIDDAPAAEFSIPLRHIVDLQWKSGPDGVERPNLARVKYYSPEQNFQLAQIDLTGIGWARIDSEISAYGEKTLDKSYPFCPDSGQAQQNGRRDTALARADSGICTTNMVGIAVWGCRFVNIEFPDGIGWQLCRIGAPRILDAQGRVEIPFVVWPQLTPFDADVDEAAAPPQLPDFAFDSPLTTPDRPGPSTKVTYPDASVDTRLAIVIPPDAGTVEVTYRTYTGALPNAWHSMTVYRGQISGGGGDVPAGYRHAYAAADLGGLLCDFRLRTFNGDNGSYWSALLNTIVPATVTAPGAIALSAADAGGDLVRVNADVPHDLDVAYVAFTGVRVPEGGGPSSPDGGAPAGNVAVRPGDRQTWTFTFAAGFIYTFTAQAFSSNGTAGPLATATFPPP